MTKVQVDQYDMVLSTEKHLDSNQTILASNASLVASMNLLSSKIFDLKVQVAKQLVNRKGITIDKKNNRTTLEEKAYVLGAACCGYASATSNTALYNRCHHTKSNLKHFRDAELIGICVNLYEDASAHATDLSSYNVNAAMISYFQAAINNFSGAMPNPLEAIAKRTTATAQIAVLVPEILNIIRTRLDNDVVSMRSSEPDFVDTYYNVRALRKSPVVTRNLDVTLLDTITLLPIPDAKVEIMGRRIRRKSSPHGNNRIINLIPGIHQLKVSHPDYQIQNRDFVAVSGEMTKLRVMMVKESEGPLLLNEMVDVSEMEHR